MARRSFDKTAVPSAERGGGEIMASFGGQGRRRGKRQGGIPRIKTSPAYPPRPGRQVKKHLARTRRRRFFLANGAIKLFSAATFRFRLASTTSHPVTGLAP